MALPNVKITFANGALGTVAPSADGTAGLIGYDLYPSDNGAHMVLYSVNELDDTYPDFTDEAIEVIREFYAEAPKGTPLHIMSVPTSDSEGQPIDLVDYIPTLLNAAKGEVRLLMVLYPKDPSAPPSDTELRQRVSQVNAALVRYAADTCAPSIAIMEAYGVDRAAVVPSFSQAHNQRVALVLGSLHSAPHAEQRHAIGLVCGRLATIGVHQSLGRVRNGAIDTTLTVDGHLYIGEREATLALPAEILHTARLIAPRTFAGLEGYFWNDDSIAATVSDNDYATIANRRVADKACRIAYSQLLQEVGEDLAIDSEGHLAAYVCKAIEASVESAIVNAMGAAGELGNDPDNASDLGVQCYIDPTQNILANSQLHVSVRIKPHGYAKYIEATLGFKTA